MGNVIDFFDGAWEHLDDMERPELVNLLERVTDRLASMDEAEPADMTCEAYEAWADRHEQLEDLADELMDRLEV